MRYYSVLRVCSGVEQHAYVLRCVVDGTTAAMLLLSECLGSCGVANLA